MPFWHEANYIFLWTSHFFSLLSSSPIAHHQIMDTQTPEPGETGSESSWTMGILSDMSHNGTQQQRRHQLVHRNAANAVTKHMTQNKHLTIICETGSSRNKKQHAIGCEYIHTLVNSGQITV